jgi:DNA-binding NtrC family response regulator
MSERTTILLVDDERQFRESWHRLLTEKGYEVITAENGKLALNILSNSRVSIIILKQKMLVVSGEDTFEILTKKYPHIPVIIITGHRNIDIAVACMKRGAYDFVVKPFEIDQLLLIIERAEAKRKL